MFELKCLVEDKKLDKALWALDGILAEPPQIIPVRGAKVKKQANGHSKVVASSPGPGDGASTVKERLIEKLRQSTGQTLTSKSFKQLMVDVGGSPNSASSYLNFLKNDGILEHSGTGEYKVNKIH